MNSHVSIRSPRRNEGRRLRFGLASARVQFQSAPPAETRGDLRSIPRCSGIEMFQSAPPAETRGDQLKFLIKSFNLGFNPLPPPKRGETARAHEHVH